VYDYELTRHGWEVFDPREGITLYWFRTEAEARKFIAFVRKGR
jgi:hypothetical protein